MRFWISLILVLGCSPASNHEVVPETPVDQDKGFRNPELPLPSEARYSASHILISWRGAAGANQSIQRTKEQAQRLAESLHKRLQAGASFTALAVNFSDDASGQRGGTLGTFQTGTMVPIFESAVGTTPVGAIGPLIETPFGFHVVRRDPIIEAHVSHILVSHIDAPLSANGRTQDEAKAIIWLAYQQVKEGESFAHVALNHSDDDTVAQNGGDLGRVGPAHMVPSFDDVLFSLAPGQVSEPFETSYGYHIVLRRK